MKKWEKYTKSILRENLIMNKTISVVVPVYNVEKYLDQCVVSIINQQYRDLDIILIDDGSTDSSSQKCDEWQKKDSRIRVFHKENGGLASARNYGLENVKGEYISFVDSDDYISNSMFSSMMNLMNSENNIDIVCCSGQRFYGEQLFEKCFEYYDTGTFLDSDIVVKRILKDEIGSQVVKGLYKKKCWSSVRFPLNRLYEDIPVTFLAFSVAKKIAFIREPYYFYRENRESISNTPKSIKPFHIFLGFEQHYLYSKRHYKDIEQLCLEKTAHYAISTYFHYCTEKKEELYEPSKYVCNFLNAHKKDLKHISNSIPKSRKFALKIYFFSKPVFKMFCAVFKMFGLQKKMGYEEK